MPKTGEARFPVTAEYSMARQEECGGWRSTAAGRQEEYGGRTTVTRPGGGHGCSLVTCTSGCSDELPCAIATGYTYSLQAHVLVSHFRDPPSALVRDKAWERG